MKRRPPKPTAEAIEEAKQNPGGWVYVIEPGYDPDGAMPPEAILGAWRVDENGRLTDEFEWNPNYHPQQNSE